MTLRQLRRLMLAATRDPSLAPVLHDAILESRYGNEYVAVFDYVRREPPRPPYVAKVIFFDPFATRRLRQLRKWSPWVYRFDSYVFRDEDLDVMNPESRLRRLRRAGLIPVHIELPRRRR